MTKERAIEILVDYINNDLDAAESDYVRSVLFDSCGCSATEIEEIGFGWLI